MNEHLINILEKIEKLFMRFGVKSVTMDDVARELGISKKTLYQQFADKNDMVKKIVLYHLNHQHSLCGSLYNNSLNPIDFMLGISEMMGKMLAQVNPSLMYDLRKYHPEAFDLVDKFKHEFVREQIKKNIEEGKQNGWYRKEVDTEVFSGFYLCLSDAVLNFNVFDPLKYSYVGLVREQILYHLHAVTSEKGKKYLLEKLNQQQQL